MLNKQKNVEIFLSDDLPFNSILVLKIIVNKIFEV